ncbi:MAG: exodeoxyribonuclease VII small subunit [Rugosibacter sp.]|nr:exodeoxyribonuclease VII small subunit [Rugosibacter sp.]
MATSETKKSVSTHIQSFEASLNELEGIIASMEAGQMPLQETMDTYKRGILLLRQCQDTLNIAEQQTRILEQDALHEWKPDVPGQQGE